MYLYILRNTQNGKAYIGITSRRPGKRFVEHVSVARLGRRWTYLAEAMRKYGPEAFTLSVLGQAETWEELCTLEMEAIAVHNTMRPHGYNLTLGGEGNYGFVMSDEQKRKLSEAALRRYASGQPHPFLGRTHTEETRLKLRIANRKQNLAGKNPMQGRKHSEATKQVMIEKRRGKAGHLAEHNRGRALSSEHRQKLSEVRKGRKAWNKGLPWHEMRGGEEHPGAHAVEYGGIVYSSVMACHKATGMARNTIRSYIKKGKARYVKD